jgi:hypothetical protein
MIIGINRRCDLANEASRNAPVTAIDDEPSATFEELAYLVGGQVHSGRRLRHRTVLMKGFASASCVDEIGVWTAPDGLNPR